MGVLVAVAAAELLPVSGKDEEAVVDRQADAESGHDLKREQVDRLHPRDQPQSGQREDDRERRDRKRQHRRGERPEDDQQEQKEDRCRVELDRARVVLGALADLEGGDRRAAGRDRRRLGERAIDRLPGLNPPGAGLEVPEDQLGRAVVGRQARIGAGRADSSDPRDPAQGLDRRGLERGEGLARLRGDEQGDLGLRRAARSPLDRQLGPHALRVGIADVERLDLVEDADGHRGGDGEQNEGDDQDPPGMEVGESSQSPHPKKGAAHPLRAASVCTCGQRPPTWAGAAGACAGCRPRK